MVASELRAETFDFAHSVSHVRLQGGDVTHLQRMAPPLPRHRKVFEREVGQHQVQFDPMSMK